MALTMILVASVVGPPLFDEHMREAGHGEQLTVLVHAQEAFRWAGSLSLAVGLVISAAGALLISVLIIRRIGHALAELTTAAKRIAAGEYDRRVRDTGTSIELSQLADSFNQMAARLAATEHTRRRLLTDLAHELRTPIATIDLGLESIEDGVIDAGPETLAMLRSQADRLTRLTQDLRDVSAAEEGRLDLRPERIDAHLLIERSYQAAREAFAQKDVKLLPQSPPMVLGVEVDPARIDQVLTNLLSNALRHTPPGGTVTLGGTQSGDQVVIQVTDTGEGIDPEHLPHLFERFYRADTAGRAHGGTGVGLAISQAIARAHDGTLTATSPGPGCGATFTLALPRA